MARAGRLAAATVLGIVAAAAVAVGIVELLHLLQWLAAGRQIQPGPGRPRPELTAWQAMPTWRRLLVPTVAGLVAGLAWWLLRTKLPPRSPGPVETARSTADAGLQTLAVAGGISVGREAAPRQIAAAAHAWAIRSWGLSESDRRIVVAASAGAALGAVYHAPLAGGLYAVEVLLATTGWLGFVIAVVTSVVATLLAGLTGLVAMPTYEWPQPAGPAGWLVVWIVFGALAAAGIGSLLRSWFSAMLAEAHSNRVHPKLQVLLMTAAGAAVGLVAIWLPGAVGNGRAGLEQSALTVPGTPGAAGSARTALLICAALVVAKPLLTGLCLRAGITGGVLTPALCVGGALGAAVAYALGMLGVQASVPTFALVGAATVLAVSQAAPLFAAVFCAELTGANLAMTLALLAGCILARAVAVRLSDPVGVAPDPVVARDEVRQPRKDRDPADEPTDH